VSGAFLGSDTVIGKIRSYYNQGRILIGYHKSFTDVMKIHITLTKAIA
jgi:hypothetical protein